MQTLDRRDKKSVVVPLTATLVVQALVSMAAVTVPIFAPTAAGDIGISATSVGIYVGLIYITSMISSLWSGDFIGRYGALRVSQVCLIFCGAGLAMAAAASVPVLVMSALVLGVGYGAVTPASSHILSRNTPVKLMSFVFSIKQTGVPLGGAAAGAIVPALVLFTGWKQAAVIVGAICGLGAVLAQPIRGGIDSDRQPVRRISFQGVTGPLRLVLNHRPLLRLAMISFFYGAMQLCLMTYLVIYLTKNIGMALISAGLTLSAAQIAGSAGRLMWGIIADRLLRPSLVLGLIGITMSLGAIATACFTPDWSYPAIWLAVIVFGASAIGWNGVYLAEAARLAPDSQISAATGGCLFFTFLGVVVGPPVFAAVATLTDSYSLGYLLFAGLTFVSALVSIAGGRKKADH
ncbi:MAG: MFS transporter [Thermodesulfobacteriota bacterium]